MALDVTLWIVAGSCDIILFDVTLWIVAGSCDIILFGVTLHGLSQGQGRE